MELLEESQDAQIQVEDSSKVAEEAVAMAVDTEGEEEHRNAQLQILQHLKSVGASSEVIKSQQMVIDGLPKPKPQKPLQDAGRLWNALSVATEHYQTIAAKRQRFGKSVRIGNPEGTRSIEPCQEAPAGKPNDGRQEAQSDPSSNPEGPGNEQGRVGVCPRLPGWRTIQILPWSRTTFWTQSTKANYHHIWSHFWKMSRLCRK